MVVFVGGIWFKIQRRFFGYQVSNPTTISHFILMPSYKTTVETSPIAARHGEHNVDKREIIQVPVGEDEGYEVLCETFGTAPSYAGGDDDDEEDGEN